MCQSAGPAAGCCPRRGLRPLSPAVLWAPLAWSAGLSDPPSGPRRGRPGPVPVQYGGPGAEIVVVLSSPKVVRHPHRYGPHHSQVADLWRPVSPQRPSPVVVLLHGGFWRFVYTKRIMNGLSAAMAERGLAVWNVEYRRVGIQGGGWPATFEDAKLALAGLAAVDGLDLSRVVTCGHSAGGHLALWLAAQNGRSGGAIGQGGVTVTGAVSLAGVADLASASELGLGHGAADRLMGGSVGQLPERYRSCSPTALLPMGVPQVLVHGLADKVVPASMSERHCQLGADAGDDTRYVPLPHVGHMQLINPRSPACSTALTYVEELAW